VSCGAPGPTIDRCAGEVSTRDTADRLERPARPSGDFLASVML
jgi:hypothetical protein